MTRQTTKPRGTKTRQTMTSFILSFDEKTPAEEVIRQGKAKGMDFSSGYVYATRSKARKRPGSTRSKRPETARDTSTTARPDHAAALVKIVLDLGLRGTRDLLSTVETRLASAASRA